MKSSFDIDIDVNGRENILSHFTCVNAATIVDNERKKHNTGVYFQAIPSDSDGVALIDYKSAFKDNYIKIDILNVSIYEYIKSEEHLDLLMNKEPLWEMLLDEEIVKNLFHLSKYYNLLKRLKPNTVDKLAAILSIIRPAKSYLQNCSSWGKIMSEVWVKNTSLDDDGYFFKKSHAYAYSLLIVVQLNLLREYNVKKLF